MMARDDQSILRSLPSVNAVLEHPLVSRLPDEHGRAVVVDWIRDELDRCRRKLQNGESGGASCDAAQLLETVAGRTSRRAEETAASWLGRVINATGVILHTGLGRSPLSQAAQSAIAEAAGAGNVEVDLASGERRYRGHQLNSAWTALTGCEDSLIVNNNAAATLLTLQAICAGREVVISRGQLIEIGGSFRLPDIFELSGAKLREVGTTNRTRLSDYERAIGPETAAIMHVHPSNYRVIGFSETPGIRELTELGHAHGLPVIDDIGSGALVDVTRFGLPEEPTFGESVAAGADLVLGSGDKLLGGPQAGIVLGRGDLVERIRSHPLARAVRVGKLTLAALSATLDSYLREAAEEEIPALMMLAVSAADLRRRVENMKAELKATEELHIEVASGTSPVGGGSLPGAELPTSLLSIAHASLSSGELARSLRLGPVRLFPRIHENRVIVDLRSVLPEDDEQVVIALQQAAASGAK